MGCAASCRSSGPQTCRASNPDLAPSRRGTVGLPPEHSNMLYQVSRSTHQSAPHARCNATPALRTICASPYCLSRHCNARTPAPGFQLPSARRAIVAARGRGCQQVACSTHRHRPTQRRCAHGIGASWRAWVVARFRRSGDRRPFSDQQGPPSQCLAPPPSIWVRSSCGCSERT